MLSRDSFMRDPQAHVVIASVVLCIVAIIWSMNYQREYRETHHCEAGQHIEFTRSGTFCVSDPLEN